MTGTPNDNLIKLQEVLHAYGSRVDRWPAAERALLEPILSADAEARLLLAQTRALEKALEIERPVSDAQSAALSARILAAAAETRTQIRVIEGGKPSLAQRPQTTAQTAEPLRRGGRSSWVPLTTLAASLILA